MIDRAERERLYNLLARHLRGERFEAKELYDKLKTGDAAVLAIRAEFQEYAAIRPAREQPVYASPVTLDWFFRSLVYLRTDLDYEWPGERLDPSRSGCLGTLVPVLILGTGLGMAVRWQWWWLWLSLLAGVIVVYGLAARKRRQNEDSWSSPVGLALWPFRGNEDYQQAAAAHQDQVRLDAPSLFSR